MTSLQSTPSFAERTLVRFALTLFSLIAAALAAVPAWAQQSPVQYGTTSTFDATSNYGAPNTAGFSCGTNFGETCYGGNQPPTVNISWTVDGVGVSSTFDGLDDNNYDCAEDDDGHAMYCDSYYDESMYSAILPVGTHTIVAFINASDDPNAAFQTTWTVTVTGAGPLSTTTAVTASTQNATYGSPIILTATVTPSGPSTPSGLVNFYEGTTMIGGGALYGGIAKTRVSNLAAGSHTVTAQYLGDAVSAPSASSLAGTITIQAGPPQMTLAVQRRSPQPGQTVNVAASLTTSPSNRPQGAISCASGAATTSSVSVGASGAANLQFSSLPQGLQTITCTFTSSVSPDTSQGSVSVNVLPSGFSSASSLLTARSEYTATVLRDGTVLYAAGRAAGQYLNSPLSSAEIYNPATGAFTATASLLTARFLHTATELQDGTVLIVGGENSNSYIAAAEYYDPSTSTFKTTGALNDGRGFHTATLLSNGKVLIAGGIDSNTIIASAELYDPLTGLFAYTGNMQHARAGHGAIALANGKVLIVGGQDPSSNPVATAELYDPGTGTFSATGSMTAARAYPILAPLPGGKILVAGGASASQYLTPLASAEIYDPATGTFTATGSMQYARSRTSGIPMLDGSVVIAGGSDGSNITATTEVYYPSAGTFSSAGSMATARESFQPVTLGDGSVLIAGGETNPLSLPQPTTAAEFLGIPGDTGGLSPKYTVVGIVYAPPGAGSSVNYSASNMLTDTSTLEHIATGGTEVDTTKTLGSFDLGPFGSGGLTLTTKSTYSYVQDNSNAYTLTHAQNNTFRIAGPLDSSIGVDHDYDVIYIWLNPVAVVTFPQGIANTILWNGYAYDTNDPYSVGNPDIIGLPVGCLKNPYLAPSCTQFSSYLARSWDTSGGGGLTLSDLNTILQGDPFAVDPNYDPTNDPNPRYTVQSGLINYPVPLPGAGSQQYSGQIGVTNTTSYTNTTSHVYNETVGVQANVSGGFLAKIGSSITVSGTAGWTDKESKLHSASTTDNATYTINSPNASDNYSGPVQLNAWLDNLYQTFMFYSPSRSYVPPTSITVSNPSNFGTVALGSYSSIQQLTITNNSSQSMSMAPAKAAAVTFSIPSFQLAYNNCTGLTLAPGGSCTIGVQFVPVLRDLPNPGSTTLLGTMIVDGIELAPGSTNVMIAQQTTLQATGTR